MNIANRGISSNLSNLLVDKSKGVPGFVSAIRERQVNLFFRVGCVASYQPIVLDQSQQ